MCFEAQYLLAAWTKWRLIDAELDADMKLDATEWRRGGRCGGHQRHGPRQRRDRRMERARNRRRGYGRGRRGEGEIRPTSRGTWRGDADLFHEYGRAAPQSERASETRNGQRRENCVAARREGFYTGREEP